MSHVLAWLSTLGGLVIFAAAYYIHQKVRLTRTACILATVGGFMTYTSAIGSWVNGFAVQTGVIAAAGVVVGVCIIVADIKGKKKGADRPALFAFFLVPIFLVAGVLALPAVIEQAGAGVGKTTTNITNQMGR